MLTGLKKLAADTNSAVPKHERLKEYVISELKSGRLQPGQALPSELEIAQTLNVARNTVRQALSSIEQIGLIERIRGKGTFVRVDVALQLHKSSENQAVLNAFGLVLPETRTGFYPSLQRGFGMSASETHNQMIVCDTDNEIQRQADILLQLMDKNVAGVALVPATMPPTPKHQIRPFQERGIPVVFCHRRVEGIRAPLVTFSGSEIGRVAGRALAKQGHRRVSFFTSHHYQSSLSKKYLDGLRAELQQHGGDVPEECLAIMHTKTPKMNTATEQIIIDELQRLFELPQPPTAIMASFDSVAEMIYLSLHKMGMNVPHDVSLIGFGGTFREGAITQKLTSVVVDEEELGAVAAQLLNEMCSGQRAIQDNSQITLPLSLSNGETLGPVNQ